MVASSGRRRPRRRRWRRLRDLWYRYVKPPGSPNLWLVIPLMLVGAVVVALLSGVLAGDNITQMARDLVKNPFRPRP